MLASALAACGSTPAPGPPTARGGEVTLVADDLMWDTDCLEARPGSLSIVVDNQDDGESHNVHLPDAPTSPATDLELGPSRQRLDVTLDPGAYEYICDIHPNMVGTLTVE